jgi:uncharacterized delta-60 repeat protein
LGIKRITRGLVVRRMVLAGLSLLLVVAAAPAARAAATLLSQTTWGGPDSEVTDGTAVAADGSTYLAGFTRSFNPSARPTIFVVKFAADGSLTWQRTWQGPEAFGDDEATDVAVAADGSVYVTGFTVGVGGDAVLLKFAPDGTLLWQRRWGGSASDQAEAVSVGADGAVYVAGGTNSFGPGGVFVLKFTPAGALVWQKHWGTGSEDGQGVAVGPNVVGASDLVVLKVDPAGALAWQRAYSAATNADARGGVTVGADGSIYAAGALQAVTTAGRAVVDALIVKFAADGSLSWDRGWGGRSGDVAGTVAVAPAGTVLLAGDTNSFGAGSDDAFVLRLSPDGRGLDAITWGGTGIDHGHGVGVGSTGTTSLGATAQSPPYSFLGAPTRTTKPKETVSIPTAGLVDAAGTVADPGGTVATPNGGTTFAGGFDAALVRMAP